MAGIRLAWIPAQFVRVSTASRSDLDQFILAGIYIAPGSTSGVARIFKVNKDLTNGGEVIIPNDLGKDDTISVVIDRSGSIIATVSEALPGGSGSTAQPEVYIVPSVFPAYAASSGTVDLLLRSVVKVFVTKIRDAANALLGTAGL